MPRLPVLIFWIAVLISAAGGAGAENIIFPPDVSINVRSAPYNARGDGITDDTQPLQQAMTDACGKKVVYIPNGTYLVKDTLRFHCLGPMIFGQSENGTVIKLADHSPGFDDPLQPKPVILTMTITGRISADQFFRKLKFFTVDTGNNPGAIGVRMYSNNEGILQHVRVLGNGSARIGIDLGWMDQNGPMLVRDCLVDGFDTGIRAAAWVNSQTLSSLVLTNCRTYGIDVGMQVFTCEALRVYMAEGASAAVHAHHGCMLSIINSSFQGTGHPPTAIKNEGANLFLRDITIAGFGSAVADTNKVILAADKIDEFASADTRNLFPDSTARSMRLPIRQTPEPEWEPDTNRWLNAAQYGAKYGDNQDDTEAFQKAFDAAAAQGKTVVYIPTVTGRDPNWYNVKGTVTVYGSVRVVMGLNFSRIIGNGRFLIRSDVNHPVEFTGIYGFGGEPPVFENDSSSTMIVRNSEARIVANSPADLFIEDVAGTLVINHPKAHVWARQLNPEARGTNIVNNGGTLWVLGLKTENYGVKMDTRAGGKTELIGAHVYTGFGGGDQSTLFRVENASASFAAVREITFTGKGFTNTVTEIRASDTRVLPRGRGWSVLPLYSAWTQ